MRKQLNDFKYSILLLVSLVVSLASSISYAESQTESQAGSDSHSDSEIIDFNWVKKTICENKVKTIEQFLPLLPESYRKNYTLMSHSPSLQAGSPENPRAILFGLDASLIMTFNGDPSQRGYNSIELSQFNRKNSQFEFREIEFFPNSNDFQGPAVSKVNPTICLACHGANPRPNWEPYQFWHNAYGGNDDDFYRDGEGFENYKKFTEKSDSHLREPHLRYKNLLRNTNEPFSPYRMNKNTDSQLSRPNLRLLQSLVRMNAMKVSARILDYPKLFQQLFVFNASGCLANSSDQAVKINSIVQSVLNENGITDIREYSREYLYFEFLKYIGLSPTQYTLNIKAKNYLFNTGDGVEASIANYIISNIIKKWNENGEKEKYKKSVYYLYAYSSYKKYENPDLEKYLKILDELTTPVVPLMSQPEASLCKVLGDEILLNQETEIKKILINSKASFEANVKPFHINDRREEKNTPMCAD